MDLAIECQELFGQNEKVLFETARLKLLVASLGKGSQPGQNDVGGVHMEARYEVQRRRFPRWRGERSLKSRRRVLGDLLNKTPTEEGAASFHRPRRLNILQIHGVPLAVIEHEKGIGIHDQVAPVHGPGDLTVNDRLDG